MPREQIVHPIVRIFDEAGEKIDEGRISYTQPVPEGGRETITSGLAINWNSGQYAQVSTQISVAALRGLLEAIDAGHVKPEFGVVSFYTDVNREQLNGAIKSIRRARNAVYGQDE